MANLTSIIEKQNNIGAILTKQCLEFEARFKTCSEFGEHMSLKQLHSEFSSFKEQMLSIVHLLRLQIAEVCKSMDYFEMLNRRKYLLISGIPENSSEIIDAVVADIIRNNLGICDVSKTAFKSVTRLGKLQSEGKARPVLVRFMESSFKTLVWKKKSCLKGTTFVISEYLTRRRQTLFIKARKSLGIRNCWTRDGIIFTKLPNGDIHKVDSDEDLVKFGSLQITNQSIIAHDQLPSASGQIEVQNDTVKQKRSARSRK